MTRSQLTAALGALLLLATSVALALATRDEARRPTVARGHLTDGVGFRRQALHEVREERARGESEEEREREAERERGGDDVAHGRSDAAGESEREVENETAHGPDTEAVDARAYPRTYVDAKRAATARTAYVTTPRRLSAADFRPGARSRAPLGASWQEVGPTTPTVPGDVTFTGATAGNSGRVTALAVDPNCSIASTCRVWVAAAGGGIWRTGDALAAQPSWQPVSQGLTTGSFGSLAVDPNDASGDTLYAGSGEANGSGDSEAGVGLFRSTDGGSTWTLLPGSTAVAKDRAIGAIALGPDGVDADSRADTIWIGTGVARHGSASVNGGRLTPPGAPTLGLYRSTDDGAGFGLIFSRPGSAAPPSGGSDWFQGGVNDIELDPNDPTGATVFAAVTGYGIWRTTNGSAATPAFAQVFATMNPQGFTGADTFGDRSEFALADTGTQTRMYAGDSSEDAVPPLEPTKSGVAELWRAGDVSASVAATTLVDTTGPGGKPENQGAWTKLADQGKAQPGYTSYRYCHGQCGYNNLVAVDPADPDTVFLGGAFDYEDFNVNSNGRAVIRSTDAGVTFRDMSSDARNACDTFFLPVPPNTCPAGMHPDTHAIGFVPDQTGVFIIGSDGGVSRSGLTVVPASPPDPGDTPGDRYVDRSATCGPTGRGLTGNDKLVCERLLAAIPYRNDFLNDGLDTLQFQSVSLNPDDPEGDLLAGAQDNGTWARRPSGALFESIGGDGGQSLIDPRVGDAGRGARVHSFFRASMDVNYGSVDLPAPAAPTDPLPWPYDPAFGASNPNTWLYISGPLDNAAESFSFYVPLISDPAVAGTMFTAGEHVWRTKDMGGPRAFLDANCQDNYYSPAPGPSCGDWVAIGPSLSAGDPANFVVALGRAPSDTRTLWVGTRHGGLWLSRNADGATPAAVAFAQLSHPALPNRFVSGIAVDPQDPNHAWISYSGYEAYTPTKPGHVFDVRVDPNTNAATVTDLSGTGADGIGDLPVTALVRDHPTGDLYVASDFGVLRLQSGATAWSKAADGLPLVAVYGLTAAPQARVLYAATHGRGLWKVALPALPPAPPATPPATTPVTPPVVKPAVRRKPRFRSARVRRRGSRVVAVVVLRSAGGKVRTVVRDRLGRRVGSRTVTLRSGRPARISVKLARGASSTLTVSLTASNAVGSSTVRRAIRPPRRAVRRKS